MMTGSPVYGVARALLLIALVGCMMVGIGAWTAAPARAVVSGALFVVAVVVMATVAGVVAQALSAQKDRIRALEGEVRRGG